MSKHITRIVLTGGPAAGKTTLISRILKEFNRDDWRVITIPESATDLISGFGIKPFGNCMSMLAFQDFVIADQIHKEKLALQAAEIVPEENVLIIYDRALLDDKAYITDEEFRQTLYRFDGRTEESVLAGYDAVLHLVTCAKGAEFAYNLGNAARTESLDAARQMDDNTLRAWSGHPNLVIIDNAVSFEVKINRALEAIYRILGMTKPRARRHKLLIGMPDIGKICAKYDSNGVEMMQTYLAMLKPDTERCIRQQRSGEDYLYFYTEKHSGESENVWETEKPISEKEYVRYLMEGDRQLHQVYKTKYSFSCERHSYEIDVYPFCEDMAICFTYTDADKPVYLPEEIRLIRDVTDEPDYKNRKLALRQTL